MADEWLIFVDTNIFLDFYRMPGESAKRQMEALERHSSRLITSDQVRMEFLKNRQKVILKAFADIKKPTHMNFPQILVDSQPVKSLKKSQNETNKRYRQLKDRVAKLLEKPGNYDEVYKSFNRIFRAKSSYNLKRPDKLRFEIRNLARKRFALGYPPRKASDTSCGDALNWEWVIKCAQDAPANHHILIVSRDGDFGSEIGDQAFLNDWLRTEFKDRVSSKRKIELTTKLTVALKRLDEVVTEEDEKGEELALSTFPRSTETELSSAVARYILENLLSKAASKSASLGELLVEDSEETQTKAENDGNEGTG